VRVLAFRHIPFESGGLIVPALAQRGISIQYVDLYRRDSEMPDPADAAGLIFLGGPMSANDDLAYLKREAAAIVQAVDREQPVLGVCLGAQLAARALGARVYRNHRKEIGWFDIHLTADGAADPLFAGVSRTETVFHWHGETFDLPQGAVLLASSDACRHQAFRFGEGVYGLQFHLEVTPEIIADWCSQDENSADVRELDGPIDPHVNAARLEELSNRVFGRWADLALRRAE